MVNVAQASVKCTAPFFFFFLVSVLLSKVFLVKDVQRNIKDAQYSMESAS